jgi:hypothetical protein
MSLRFSAQAQGVSLAQLISEMAEALDNKGVAA